MITIRKQAKRFWKAFELEKNNLEKALIENDIDEINEIKKILGTYFEELCNCSIEINEEDGIFELTLLPELDKNAQIICELTKKIAPEGFNNWVIHACLPPLSQKALNTVLRIENIEYGADDFQVFYDIDEESRCFNLEIYCPAFATMDANKALEIGYYMLELFIGEAAFEGYINQVNVIDQVSEDSNTHIALSHFYECLLEIVEDKKWSVYNDPTAIYRVYQINDDKISEDVRKDMKVIFTIHANLMNEILNDEQHLSTQFFDFGGEFGYLYYQHYKNEVNDSLVRQSLEKSLNELLYPLGIARSIGGAIGTKYAYIDLAIFDKKAFISALSKINEKLDIKLVYESFE